MARLSRPPDRRRLTAVTCATTRAAALTAALTTALAAALLGALTLRHLPSLHRSRFGAEETGLSLCEQLSPERNIAKPFQRLRVEADQPNGQWRAFLWSRPPLPG